MPFHHDANATTSLAIVLFLTGHVIAPELKQLGLRTLALWWPRLVHRFRRTGVRTSIGGRPRNHWLGPRNEDADFSAFSTRAWLRR